MPLGVCDKLLNSQRPSHATFLINLVGINRKVIPLYILIFYTQVFEYHCNICLLHLEYNVHLQCHKSLFINRLLQQLIQHSIMVNMFVDMLYYSNKIFQFNTGNNCNVAIITVHHFKYQPTTVVYTIKLHIVTCTLAW